ncbi:MAG: NAD(+) diphosphatase [Anaerolineae bacterium]|nr:NAD(+) diphosphatase [Anaerolineae bacterium]
MSTTTKNNYQIDRLGDKRKDTEWLATKLQDPATHIIPLWKMLNLFTTGEVPHPVLLTWQDLALDPIASQQDIILLGKTGNQIYFTVNLPDGGDMPPLQDWGQFQDLREVRLTLNFQEQALLAYAKAIVYWHRQTRFCGYCGSPTESQWNGHLRVCTNPECGAKHFPRTDPAIIVLVQHQDKCLLGRQATWQAGRYSTLAGFVEPGESFEEAVAREVYEESGVRVKDVVYKSSQPWPFPQSVMVGFHAQATSTEVHLNDGELEGARWFSREEIQTGIEQGTLTLSPPIAISYRLIESWFDVGSEVPLAEIRRR